RRLGAGEFADDDVAHEFAQRANAAVMAVRREISRTAQAGDPHRIEHVVVGLWIEQWTCGVEGAGPCRHAGDEQLGIARAVDVAGAAADAGTAGDITEYRR